MSLIAEIETLSPVELDTFLEGLQKLGNPQKRLILSELQREAAQRSAEDGLFWLKFVKTRDEADPETPVKPFPAHLAYVQELWGVLVLCQKVVIAKSRQMLVSWILCAFGAWWARTRSHQLVLFQTQKKEDANKMVALPSVENGAGYMGRMQFIEWHMPEWLKVPLRPSEGMLSYANGSLIEAVAGGANQVRSKVPSIIMEDEFAFQEEARGVYGAVAPLIQKQTKFIACSTPNGMDNIFADLYHGYRMEKE